MGDREFVWIILDILTPPFEVSGMTFQALGIAFSQGLISSLSACVYPLIPITTAIFGAGRVGHWMEGFLLSSVYVAGMSITYVSLGLIAALGGSVFGAYMGSSEAIVIFAVLFILLGLGFLGVIPLPLPNLGDKLHVEKKESILYPLILGIFSGFIAAPCTAPLFGALMIDIAQNAANEASLLPGITQALAFSLGMGLPFLFIGGFALKLPKPGKWLQAVKYVGATVLFASAFHYLEDLVAPYPAESYLFRYAFLGAAIFFVFLALSEPLSDEPVTGLRSKFSLTLSLFVAAFGLFLATSPLRTTNVSFSSQDISNQSDFKPGEHGWYSDYQEGLRAAEEKQTLALIDFWAEWCAACFKMEKDLFTSDEFRDFVAANNIVLIRLDFTDTDTQEKEDIAQKYEIHGLPTLVIADEDGEMVGKMLGFRNKELALERLSEILEEQ